MIIAGLPHLPLTLQADLYVHGGPKKVTYRKQIYFIQI